MSTFNKIYKKIANNGDSNDYQVVGQVGVSGVPLDIMKGASSSSDGIIGLVPKPTKGNQNKYLRADGTWQTPPDTNTTYPLVSTTNNGLMSVNDKIKLDNVDNFMKKIVANDSDNFVSGTNTLPYDKSEITLDDFYLDKGHLYIYQSQLTIDGSGSNTIEYIHYRHTGDEYIKDFHNFLDSYALCVSGAYYNTITLTSFIDLRSASKKYHFGANSWSTIGRNCSWSRKVKIML